MESSAPGHYFRHYDPPNSQENGAEAQRIQANAYPGRVRPAFIIAYPDGLPAKYNMARRTTAEGVPDRIIEDNFDKDFYTKSPDNVSAIFSTKGGRLPFRKANVDSFKLGRERRLWSQREIDLRCNDIRREHAPFMKLLEKPRYPETLFKYFDPHDIYEDGPQNRWNLLNTLYAENEIIAKIVERDFTEHIREFVDKWLARGNGRKLKNWASEDGIMELFSEDDWQAIGNIDKDMVAIFEKVLEERKKDFESIKPDNIKIPVVKNCENLQVHAEVFDYNANALLPKFPPSECKSSQVAFTNVPTPNSLHDGQHRPVPAMLGYGPPGLSQSAPTNQFSPRARRHPCAEETCECRKRAGHNIYDDEYSPA
ncbi:uncharacterized protein MAM_02077 [Metarhizium album ARSEF 1941]|uniref:Uncharacterized protein n=1 Tax=Metarhizium album (strain ARSEF 1941) TaxID=1081103 RepID=A0A0B2X1E9_METAS|nr:uncharacterized protein MAM_02077 [Metarhizium album ARSEF 1941]KHO00154.1 hypothetical protein MAM_02077 [Metarhizium album ARSEF 1941]